MSGFLKNKYFLLGIMALTWGSSFILIKKTLPVFTPFQMGAFRVGFSGLLLSFIGFKALKKYTKKDIFWLVVTGFFGNFIPMFVFPLAQTRVSSSLAGMINALEPIFTLVLGYLLFSKKPQKLQNIGAIIGFGGAFILLSFSDTEHSGNYLFYTLLMVIASAFYAISSLIVKEKLQHLRSTELSSSIYTLWMLPSFIILIFSGFFTEIDFSLKETWTAMGYLLFLTVISTTLVMLLFYKLIQDTSAVFASSVSFLIPLVAVIWGILDGEHFVMWYALGGILILIGIYLIKEKKI